MGSAVSDKKMNEIKTLEEFENEWKEKRPGVIYHYTSIDSCWNILRTSTFRASHIMFQNDYSELKEAFDLIEEKLRKIENQEIKEKILKKIKLMLESALFPIYTISFINENKENESNGSLSQWRGYGDNGAGCRIGINSGDIEYHYTYRKFNKNCKNQFCNMRKSKVQFCKCIYEEHEKEIFVDALITKLFPQNQKKFIPELADDLLNLFLIYAPILKNKAYKDECEWRLVFSNVPEHLVEFDNNKPYVTIPIYFQGCYEGILLGPRIVSEFATRKLSYQLIRNNICNSTDGCKISQSTIPYRG